MSYEPKDGSGALFKNDKKGNENAPDYKGDILVAGKAYSLAAWLKTSKSGTKYMSLQTSEPRKKEARSPALEPNFEPNDDTC